MATAGINRLLVIASHHSFCSMAAKARNILITRLSRQGQIFEARKLFDETSQPDVTSWTALIAAYARSGNLHDAEVLFNRSDSLRNIITWTALLSGYARSGHLRAAEDLFKRMPEKNVVSWNTMISVYCANGMIDNALKLFDEMPFRNIVSWNMMISTLAQSGKIDDARNLFFCMKDRDVVSWTTIVTGLSQNGRVDEARDMFDVMPHRNVISWNAMIAGYIQNGRICQALHLFESMPERNIGSWNSMITGLIQNKDLKGGRKLFNEMRVRNVISWTAMISGYVQEGENELALKTFIEMLAAGIKPNEGTYVSVLAAVSSIAAYIEGLQVHQIISKTKFQYYPFVESALLSMYSKCGDIGTARKVFDISNQKDLGNWNGMIAAYAHHGYGNKAIRMFEDMHGRNLKPNDITYIALLSACSHSGLVEEGLKFFNALLKDSSIEVRDDHYACMVDICSRAGRLNKLSGLNIDSPSFVWGALLGGCNFYKNVNIGKFAARELLKADPCNTNAYTLMSNIYASNGEWNEIAEIRSQMRERGLKRQPGCSWIQIGNKVHVFMTWDRLHLQIDSIDCILYILQQEMKVVEYGPLVCGKVSKDKQMDLISCSLETSSAKSY